MRSTIFSILMFISGITSFGQILENPSFEDGMMNWDFLGVNGKTYPSIRRSIHYNSDSLIAQDGSQFLVIRSGSKQAFSFRITQNVLLKTPIRYNDIGLRLYFVEFKSDSNAHFDFSIKLYNSEKDSLVFNLDYPVNRSRVRNELSYRSIGINTDNQGRWLTHYVDSLVFEIEYISGFDTSLISPEFFFALDNVQITSNFSSVEKSTSNAPEDHSFYPNPFQDMLFANNLEPGGILRFFNVNGQLTAEIKPSGSSISLPDFPCGVYWVEYRTSDAVYRQKLIRK